MEALLFRYFFSDDEGKRDELLEKMGRMWDSWIKIIPALNQDAQARLPVQTPGIVAHTKLSKPRPSSCRFKM